MEDLHQKMIDVATGKLRHDWMGLCPDSVEGFDSRDSKCPACQVLVKFADEYDRLTAENAKLREVLGKIAAFQGVDIHGHVGNARQSLKEN